MFEAFMAAEEPPFEPVVPAGWERTVEELHYTPAIIANGFVFLSGVVAGLDDRLPDDPPPEAEAMEASFDRAFQAIGGILAEAGTDWDHVIAIETFHTDLPSQIDMLAKVKDRYIQKPYPVWTAIDIDRLYPDGGLVEIKVTALARD